MQKVIANNYVNFFEVLKKLNSEFKDIQAFGSDGDLALLNAVAICYPSPLHLTCSDHKKSNIERKPLFAPLLSVI
jgi:hypothetical protein